MKLTYWVSCCLDDAPAYSLRGKTRKAVKALLAEQRGGKYGKVHKVTVEYRDAFDLLSHCLGEGGVYEDIDDGKSEAETEGEGATP